MTEWLNAYLDGELRGGRLHQVEAHLAECLVCQAELQSLQNLSSLLHEVPAPEFISSERFAAQINLRLPRERPRSSKHKAQEVGWWLTPVGILGMWLFLQVTFSLSSLVLKASNAGLLGNTFSFSQGNQPQTQWFAALTSWFGSQIGANQTVFSTLNNADLFIHNLIAPFIWQALLAVIYLGWLASWWFRQQGQSSNNLEVQTGS
jgi:predicted anti-sigma-YlaC factor YlaD